MDDKNDPINLSRVRSSRVRDELISDLLRTRVPAPQGNRTIVKAANSSPDERANDQAIDLDADAWVALKDAIERSPRFQEMFQAGGTFTDACAIVRSWLAEAEPEQSPSLGARAP